MSLLATFGLILICSHAWAIETEGYPLCNCLITIMSVIIYTLLVALLAIFIYYFFRNVQEKKVFATKMEEFLERFREILRNGNATLGLPPVDPLVMQKVPLNLDIEDLIKLDATLEDVDVRGLSDYTVNSADLKIIGVQLTLNLTWKLIYVTTDYDMKGILGDDMTIFGNGDMKIGVKGFDLYVDLKFTMNGAHLKVKSLDTKFALQALKFDATGLMGDDELSGLLSAMISDVVPELVDKYQKKIQDIIHPPVIGLIDEFLSDKTLSDIIKWLG